MQPITDKGCVVDLGGESEAMAFLREAAPAIKVQTCTPNPRMHKNAHLALHGGAQVVLGVLKGLAMMQRVVTGLKLDECTRPSASRPPSLPRCPRQLSRFPGFMFRQVPPIFS